MARLQPPLADDEGEVIFVIGYGRVPHKIPKRIPIGLALTLFAGDISPTNCRCSRTSSRRRASSRG